MSDKMMAGQRRSDPLKEQRRSKVVVGSARAVKDAR
jgi:hypothetical protein